VRNNRERGEQSNKKRNQRSNTTTTVKIPNVDERRVRGAKQKTDLKTTRDENQ